MKKAIYPGSFDPITNGHIDIINRALAILDEVIVAVSFNQEKSPIFTLEERIEHIKKCFPKNDRIKVASFNNLLVDFAQEEQCPLVIRGLRAASDFEFEYQLASMNRKLSKNFETIFLMTGSETYFLSSRLVKEVALLGGDVSKMVPPHVATSLSAKREINQTL